MKIKCISDSVSIETSSKAVVEWANNSEMEITKGKTYVVLAISKYLDTIFYYILSDEPKDYPLAFPSNLFEITDYRFSKCWNTSLIEFEQVEDIKIRDNEIISFNEWVLEGDKFYEKLLEGEKKEVRIFNLYRDEMLKEFY
jgi:hypothetical protein